MQTLMSLVYTPLPVPTQPIATPPNQLNEKERAEYDRVLAHFSNPDYESSLMEEERMWLVRRSFLALSPSHIILPVLRVHPSLPTRHQTRRLRGHQPPRSHPQVETRLWDLLPHHPRTRRTRSRHRKRVPLWLRHPRKTRTLHVSQQTKHTRGSTPDPLRRLGPRTCRRPHGSRCRVRPTSSALV